MPSLWRKPDSLTSKTSWSIKKMKFCSTSKNHNAIKLTYWIEFMNRITIFPVKTKNRTTNKPFLRAAQLEEDPLTKPSEAYPSAARPPFSNPSAGNDPQPPMFNPAQWDKFPMLALFLIAPSVNLTPNNFTPRAEHVLALCPLWLHDEHFLVIASSLSSTSLSFL